MTDRERLNKVKDKLSLSGNIEEVSRDLTQNPAILLFKYGEPRDISVFDFKRKFFINEKTL